MMIATPTQLSDLPASVIDEATQEVLANPDRKRVVIYQGAGVWLEYSPGDLVDEHRRRVALGQLRTRIAGGELER